MLQLSLAFILFIYFTTNSFILTFRPDNRFYQLSVKDPVKGYDELKMTHLVYLLWIFIKFRHEN
jgi:hypothetical protein